MTCGDRLAWLQLPQEQCPLATYSCPGGRPREAGVSEPSPAPTLGPSMTLCKVGLRGGWGRLGCSSADRSPLPSPTPPWAPGKGLGLLPRGLSGQAGRHRRGLRPSGPGKLQRGQGRAPVLPRLPGPHVPMFPATRPGSGREKRWPRHGAGGRGDGQCTRVLWPLERKTTSLAAGHGRSRFLRVLEADVLNRCRG